MLFAITTWIIALTVIGILAVFVFRCLCEPEQDLSRKFDEEVKLSPHSNHYEPLKHQLKEIEAAESGGTALEAKVTIPEKDDSKKPVAEEILVDVKPAQPVVVEEKKPLNTQSLDSPDALQEVRVTKSTVAAVGASSNASVVKTVVIETQHTQYTQQTPVSPVVENSAVSAPESPRIPSSPPPVEKVSNVSGVTVAPIVVAVTEKRVELEAPENPPPPPPTDTVAQELPNNNEIPTPYNEVESTTLPRINGPTEATVTVATVLPA